MKNESYNSDVAAERQARLTRRRFLSGVGACIALPAFESLLRSGVCEAAAAGASELATSASGAPMRMAFVYFPNGAIPANWWPKGDEKSFELNRTMQPLENVRNQLQILGG